MRILGLFFTFTALLIICSITGSAQESPPAQKKLFDDYWQTTDSLAIKLKFARNQINTKNYDGAAAYLELMAESYPENKTIRSLRRQCYRVLGQHYKLELLLKEMLAENPNDIGARRALIEAIAQQGNHEEAIALFDETITVLPTENVQVIRSLLTTLLNADLSDPVYTFITEYRQRKNSNSFFAIEMGSFYERQKAYTKAAAEYHTLLSDTTGLGAEAERKLAALLRFADSSEETEKYLVEHSQKDSLGFIAGLLSNYYLSTDRYDIAYRYLIEQDSLSGFKGNRLVSYMSGCFNRKLYQPTVTMGAYLEKIYSDNLGILLSAGFFYGDALAELNRYDESERIYQLIFDKSRSPRDKARALFHLGRLAMDKRKDYSRALTLFDSVTTTFPHGRGYQLTLTAIPTCYVKQGELDMAYEKYDQIHALRLFEDLKEEALFQQAMIRLYQRQIDAAGKLLDKQMVTYPTGLFFNDAVQMKLLITEASDYPHILNDYTRGLYYQALGNVDSMVFQWEKVAANPIGLLADIALFRLVEHNRLEQRSDKLITYSKKLREQFPESYYIPFCLKYEAEVYLANPARVIDGKALYRELLEKYPLSPFTEEVREKLRNMEADADTA